MDDLIICAAKTDMLTVKTAARLVFIALCLSLRLKTNA